MVRTRFRITEEEQCGRNLETQTLETPTTNNDESIFTSVTKCHKKVLNHAPPPALPTIVPKAQPFTRPRERRQHGTSMPAATPRPSEPKHDTPRMHQVFQAGAPATGHTPATTTSQHFTLPVVLARGPTLEPSSSSSRSSGAGFFLAPPLIYLSTRYR
jgi:hypothetical protein